MEEGLKKRLEEIQKEINAQIMIGEEIRDEFVIVGIRQGCPSSGELESEISKVQGGGVSIGKERVRTIA